MVDRTDELKDAVCEAYENGEPIYSSLNTLAAFCRDMEKKRNSVAEKASQWLIEKDVAERENERLRGEWIGWQRDCQNVEARLAQATEALRHVWGCPCEPFACENELHELATALCAEHDAAALAADSNAGQATA